VQAGPPLGSDPGLQVWGGMAKPVSQGLTQGSDPLMHLVSVNFVLSAIHDQQKFSLNFLIATTIIKPSDDDHHH
jgi:hypothetical protein